MIGVQGLDIGTYRRRPICDHRGRAGGAARLVGEFPREDGRRNLVPVDNKVDIVLVGALTLGVSIKGGGTASEGCCVCRDSAEVTIVVEQRHDELDTVGFGSRDNIV